MESKESKLTITDIKNKIDKGLIWERKDKKFRKDKGGEYKTRDRKEWERSNFVKTYLAVFFHPDGFTQTDIAKAGILFQKDKRGEYLPYSESSKGAVIRALIEELVEEKWIKYGNIDKIRERIDDRKKVYVINEEKEIITQFMQKYTLNELQLIYVKQELNKLRANSGAVKVIMNEFKKTPIIELEDIIASIVYILLDIPIEIFLKQTSKITFLKEDIKYVIWNKITDYRRNISYLKVSYNKPIIYSKGDPLFMPINFFEYPILFHNIISDVPTYFFYLPKEKQDESLEKLNKDPTNSYPKLFDEVLNEQIKYIDATDEHFIKELIPNWKDFIKAEAMLVKNTEMVEIAKYLYKNKNWINWYLEIIFFYLYYCGDYGYPFKVKKTYSEFGSPIWSVKLRNGSTNIHHPSFFSILNHSLGYAIRSSSFKKWMAYNKAKKSYKEKILRDFLESNIKHTTEMREELNKILFEIGVHHLCDEKYLIDRLKKWSVRVYISDTQTFPSYWDYKKHKGKNIFGIFGRGHKKRDYAVSYLFSLDIGYKKHLKMGKVDKQMRNEFRNKENPLSNDAKISRIDENTWNIESNNTRPYVVEVTDKQLNVYYGFTIFKKIPETNDDFREGYIEKYKKAVVDCTDVKNKGWKWSLFGLSPENKQYFKNNDIDKLINIFKEKTDFKHKSYDISKDAKISEIDDNTWEINDGANLYRITTYIPSGHMTVFKVYGEDDLTKKIESQLKKHYYYKAPISKEYMKKDLPKNIDGLSSTFPMLKELEAIVKKLMETPEDKFKDVFIELFIGKAIPSETESK